MHGIPWWSPSGVQTTNHCVCEGSAACLLIIVAVHIGNKGIFHQISPLTFKVTVNSRNVRPIDVPQWRRLQNSMNESLKDS